MSSMSDLFLFLFHIEIFLQPLKNPLYVYNACIVLLISLSTLHCKWNPSSHAVPVFILFYWIKILRHIKFHTPKDTEEAWDDCSVLSAQAYLMMWRKKAPFHYLTFWLDLSTLFLRFYILGSTLSEVQASWTNPVMIRSSTADHRLVREDPHWWV